MGSENPLPSSPFHSSYQKPPSSLSSFLLPLGSLGRGGVELFREVQGRGGGLDGWMKEWRREGGENCGFGKYYSPPHLSFLLHDQEPLSSFLLPKRLRYFSSVGIVGGEGEISWELKGTPWVRGWMDR